MYEQDEESPVILEGGVEENVYNNGEDDEQESTPILDIPEEEEPKERQKTPYELSDEDLTDILQNIIRAKTTESSQSEPIFEDSFPTLPKWSRHGSCHPLMHHVQTHRKRASRYR